MATLIKCPNPDCGHHFPVNPTKHKNRRERFCPHCRTPIIVRSRLGKFNPKWPEQKLKQQADRVWSKEMGKQGKKEKQPMPMFREGFVNAWTAVVNIFLESLRMKKALEEAEKKNEPT